MAWRARLQLCLACRRSCWLVFAARMPRTPFLLLRALSVRLRRRRWKPLTVSPVEEVLLSPPPPREDSSRKRRRRCAPRCHSSLSPDPRSPWWRADDSGGHSPPTRPSLECDAVSWDTLVESIWTRPTKRSWTIPRRSSWSSTQP